MRRNEAIVLGLVLVFCGALLLFVATAVSPIVRQAIIWFVVINLIIAAGLIVFWRIFRTRNKKAGEPLSVEGSTSVEANDVDGNRTDVLRPGSLPNNFGEPAIDRVPVVKVVPLVAKREQQIELSRTDWKSLRGIPFEKFVCKVFQANGCVAIPTATSKDHGTDLVVTIFLTRYSVQVKSDGSRVGNAAVMQAIAGMIPHHCNGSMVVTNNWYTPAAKELAASRGTLLFDVDDLENLIVGRHTLFQMPAT